MKVFGAVSGKVVTTPVSQPGSVFGKELRMAKSGRRDQVKGALDKFAGRVLEAFSKLTGNRSAGATGKAARGRGAERSAKGRVKRTAR